MPIYTPGPTYRASLADWRLLRDCDIGEPAVKMAGSLYLRKLSDQSDEEYEHYLHRAMFPGILRRTVDDFVAMIVDRDPEIQLGAAESLRPQLDTVTHDGQSFLSFVAKVLREVILIGRYGGLVDAMPDGSRVYMVGYPAESIINTRTRYVVGTKQPTLIVLEESVETWEDPFIMDERRIYRTLSLLQGDLGKPEYQQGIFNPDAEGSYPDVANESFTPTVRGVPFDSIPFTFFGSRDLSWTVQRSPMLDIALLNLHLYRFLADLNWGLHFTALPTPVISGAVGGPGGEEKAQLAIGPSRVWELDAGATATMLEFTGSGLTFLENAVKSTMDTMRVLGARMIGTGANQGSENPQVANLREQGERSALYSVADTAERGLTCMLKTWVRFNGLSDDGVSCTLSRDFRGIPMDENMAVALMRMYRGGNLPQDIVDQALVEGGFLPGRVTTAQIKTLRAQPGQLPDIPADKL
jgi:hypothetical protein